MCGSFMPPPSAKQGESKFGFTASQRVKVIKDTHFQDWHGHVRAFRDVIVAVDLDEPPPGHQKNGQWFLPENLRKAPINIVVKYGNHYVAQFHLERHPFKRQELALMSETDDQDWGYNGIYRISHVGPPPAIASQFQWEVQLEKIRDLLESDQAILVDYYPHT